MTKTATLNRFFNVDKIALHWKKMLSQIFIAREEKSMLGFKPSKHSLTLFLGVNAANFRLNPMLIYHSKNPKVLKNYAKSTPPVLHKWTKTWMTTHMFTTWFTEYFKPTVDTYCSEKRFLSK